MRGRVRGERRALAVARSVAPRAIGGAFVPGGVGVLRACVALSAGAERSPRRVAEARDRRTPGRRARSPARRRTPQSGKKSRRGRRVSAAARRSAALWTALAALAVQADGVAVGALGARLRVEAAEVFLRASLEASNGSTGRVRAGFARPSLRKFFFFGVSPTGEGVGEYTNGDPGRATDSTRTRTRPTRSVRTRSLRPGRGGRCARSRWRSHHLRRPSPARQVLGARWARWAVRRRPRRRRRGIRAGYHARGRETVVANDGALRRDDPGSEASGGASKRGFPGLPARRGRRWRTRRRRFRARDVGVGRRRDAGEEILAPAPEFSASSNERDERNASDGARFVVRALRGPSAATTMFRFGRIRPGTRRAARS